MIRQFASLSGSRPLARTGGSAILELDLDDPRERSTSALRCLERNTQTDHRIALVVSMRYLRGLSLEFSAVAESSLDDRHQSHRSGLELRGLADHVDRPAYRLIRSFKRGPRFG